MNFKDYITPLRIKKLSTFFPLLIICLSFKACIVVPEQYSGLPPGPWRAVLKLEPRPVIPNPDAKPMPEKVNMQFEEVMEGELPFNFEVIYDTKEDYHIEFIHGEERIYIDEISMGRTPSRARDTVRIDFPVFDSYIVAYYEENVIEGRWIVPNRGNYSIPFVAYHGKDHRFTSLRKEPLMDISGKWEAYFEIETDSPYKAIGEFVQNGNHLTGTFLTETGDYRYLEGTVQADKAYLSTFDGAHAFLFEAKIREDSTMIGTFRSGSHYKTTWEAKRNPYFELGDPDTLTYIKEGYEGLAFEFPNTEGILTNLEDKEFEGKVKVVQIMGTWCPNCRDETNYLLEYLKNNPSDKLQVISLAFEKYRENDQALLTIKNFKEELNIPYPILLAGYYNKKEALNSLPMLNHILSYPTLIVLDENNEIKWIHTGFKGPATSGYDEFKQKFETIIGELIAD